MQQKIFKAKGKGANHKGKSGLREEEKATRREEEGEGGVGLEGSEGLSLPGCVRPAGGTQCLGWQEGVWGLQGRTACLHLEPNQ